MVCNLHHCEFCLQARSILLLQPHAGRQAIPSPLQKEATSPGFYPFRYVAANTSQSLAASTFLMTCAASFRDSTCKLGRRCTRTCTVLSYKRQCSNCEGQEEVSFRHSGDFALSCLMSFWSSHAWYARLGAAAGCKALPALQQRVRVAATQSIFTATSLVMQHTSYLIDTPVSHEFCHLLLSRSVATSRALGQAE